MQTGRAEEKRHHAAYDSTRSQKNAPPEHGTDGANMEENAQGEAVRLVLGRSFFRDIPGIGVNNDAAPDLKDSAEALLFLPSPLPVAFRA